MAARPSKEVSYENQTELFRQIGRKDWARALAVLKERPHEAKIWVVTKYRGGALVESATDLTVWYRRLPLHHACSSKNVSPQLIRALVDVYPAAIVQRDETGKVPLIHACRRDSSLDILRTVLTPETAKKPDSEGKCALHWACEYRSEKAKVQLIVETAPAVLKHRDCYGRLPLHWESSVASERKEKMKVINYLLAKYPPAVKVKDADGRTPMQMIDLAPLRDLLTRTHASLLDGAEGAN